MLARLTRLNAKERALALQLCTNAMEAGHKGHQACTKALNLAGIEVRHGPVQTQPPGPSPTNDDTQPSAPAPSPQALAATLHAQGYTLADLACLLATAGTLVATNAAEKLLDAPLAPLSPRQGPKPNVMRAAITAAIGHAISGDRRTIHDIAPNPRQFGSKGHARWQLYREGMTVAEYLAQGGKLSDVQKHNRRGWITLRNPDGTLAPVPPAVPAKRRGEAGDGTT